MIQQHKKPARRAFRGLAGSPLAVVEAEPNAIIQPLVEPMSVMQRVLLNNYIPSSEPNTIEEWRTLHADLLAQDDISWDSGGRKDMPDFDQMDETFVTKGLGTSGGLGETEKRQMGQVKVTRGTGSLHLVPVWFNNATAVRQFLTINFPYLGHNYYEETQTAAKWLFVIERWRVNMKASKIAREWNTSPHDVDPNLAILAHIFGQTTPIPTLDANQVRSVLAKIINVAAGLTQNGKAKAAKRGRPKKAT